MLKLKNVIKITTIIILILLVFSNVVFGVGDVISGAKDFVKIGEDARDRDGSTIRTIKDRNLKNTSNLIYNVLFSVAIFVAVAQGTYIGLKFVMVSPSEKAEVKESLIPFVVGCVVVFGAFGIWKIMTTLLSNL